MMKLNSEYFYLLVILSYEEKYLPYELTESHLHVIFKTSLMSLFGETAVLPFNVLRFDDKTHTAILRVPKEIYVKMRASLSFLTCMHLGGVDIAVTATVVSASSCLLSLAGPTRPSLMAGDTWYVQKVV